MNTDQRQNLTLMWSARICGLATSAVWMFIIIQAVANHGFTALRDQTSTGVILILLITTLSLGVLFAWLRPLPGGKFVMILSIMLSIFTYFSDIDNRWVPIVYQSLPFFLVGLLFVQSQADPDSESET